MEDFSNLLWILLIGGSVIVSVVTKNKEEKRKKDTTPASDMPDHQDTIRRQEHSRPLARTTDEPFQSFPQSTAPAPQVSKLRNSKRAQTAVPQPAAPDAAHTPDTDQNTPTEFQEGITADFDLRKAVIWSEILKPKFDEK